MIPWDYNLAFGTFQGNQASDSVNDDIDSPLSVTGNDRPMIDWIFSSEEHTDLYHQYFQEFLDTVDAATIISQAKEVIAPYVEKDPTKFCTYEEFEKAVETLATFCCLRSQSVSMQLAGEDADVDASFLNLSDMGTMGKGSGDRGQRPGVINQDSKNNHSNIQIPSSTGSVSNDSNQSPRMPEGMEMSEGTGNRFPGQKGHNQGNFLGGEQVNTNTVQKANQWILLVITVVILAVGLLFASKFKR